MNEAREARPATRVAQAWIELLADDPEAVSALSVARTRLAVGGELTGLKRLRIMELQGQLPSRPRLERLLHRSTQFYNPHKERCQVRTTARDKAPVPAGRVLLIVSEKDGERRPAAERWWRHETDRGIEVREGVAWVVELRQGADPGLARALLEVRDRRHGLLCNPHSQRARIVAGKVPLSCLGAEG